jgi:hydroxymethylbilane synthase
MTALRATDRHTIRVGTRGSALARRQTDIVIQSLQDYDPSVSFSVEIIKTQGDEHPDVEFSQLSTQGVFVRRIEAALLAGEIDLAVHSFKDMPSVPTPGLTIGAFLPREDPRDALVASDGLTLAGLPTGSSVGTGSPRRQALLRSVRPDLDVRSVRGNVDTRLRRVTEGDLDAVILAMAGLRRLGLDERVTEALDPRIFVPAAGQGIIAVQGRSDDRRTQDLLAKVDDRETRIAALTERAVAVAIDAGCQTPFGVFGLVDGSTLHLDAFIAPGDRRPLIRVSRQGPVDDGAGIGTEVGQTLLATLNERPR